MSAATCHLRSVGCLVAAIGLAASLSVAPASAQTPEQAAAQALREELDRLRQEFEAIRQQYDQRLSTIESRLVALEGRPPGAPAGPPGAQPPAEAVVPPGAAGAGGPTGALPVYGSTSVLSKIFNPDIAVIGNAIGAVGTNPTESALPAVQFDEAEATFQAIVDPYARADFFFGFSPEGVEIEEGYVTFPTLPGGLLMKVGKTYAQFGKVNTLHTHQVSWVDRPLLATAYFGEEGQISDGGISVSRLLLNPWFFLEATGEVYGGRGEVFQAHTRDQLLYVGRLRGYRDLSDETNVDVGTSVAYGHNELGPEFTTRLIGVDATFRYRPLQRAIYRRFLGRTELVWSRRGQEDGDQSAFGMYVSGDYQFGRRWFAGARFDYAEHADAPSLADKAGSLLLTYWPSEFSQIRGQLRRTHYAEGNTANEFLFQFLFTLGAHGAHVF